jgi:phage terminase small subunit
MSLSPRQEAFAAGVAQGLSQAESYRRAYPRSKKWKDETVYSRASELMADRKISGRVNELMAKAAAANEVTQERIVKELARIAFGNKRAVMAWGPGGVALRASVDLTDDEAAMVAEVQETVTQAGSSLKLKAHDKVKALELLGKHVGMFSDKVQVSNPDGSPIAPTVIKIVAAKK